MNKQTEKALVPKLRFPEFRGVREWKEREIGEIIKVTRGEVLSMKLVADGPSKENPYPVYSSQTKNNGLSGFYSDHLYENAITWTTDGANAGDVNYRTGKFYCTNVCGVLINTEGYANVFTSELLNSVTKKHVSYVGNPKLMNGVMTKIRIPFSSLPEQQKVADCLSSIDELITTQTQKLDTLKSHKKGLMQQLFPAEGETVPKLRFPEFRNAGEWVEKSIQELIDAKIIISHLDGNHGALYPRAEEFLQEGVPYISANDFITGFVDFSGCKHLPIQRALQFKKGVAKDGDILFAHNATVGPVAKLITNLQFVILSTTATYFRCDNKNLINDFLKFFLSSPLFVKQYTRVMSQSTRNQVPITTQRKFSLQVPPFAEQQKIADCLSSIDELITAQAQKLDTLKAHKKGLMQELFPHIDEVNG